MSYTSWGQSIFERAESCVKSEKYQQAKSLFEKFLEQNPNDLKSLEYLGDIECHYKAWKAAIPYYQKIKKINPTDPEYNYKYGGALAMLAKESNTLQALSMIGDIKAAFSKVISLNPKHIGARWALIEIYIQVPGIVGGSERKAIQYSQELLTISPVDGYLSRGHIEEYYKRYNQAEKQYKKAIEIGNSKTSYQKLADLYKNKMEQPQKAKQLLDAFNEKNKS